MKKGLTRKQLFLLSGTLFSMHFGSSCLLYPVTWGKEAGNAVGWMYAGVFLSGVLLPFLGYLALARGWGNFLDLATRAAPHSGRCLVLATLLLLGPVYVVPRMTAAAWAACTELLGAQRVTGIWPVLFHLALYSLLYWFVASRGKIVKRVGTILFPILLCIVGAVIAKGLVARSASNWAVPEFSQNAVFHGIFAGYATGDLPCALFFGVVLIESIQKTASSRENVSRSLVCVSGLGLGFLALTHLGHMLAGANLSGTVSLTLSALYTRMVLLEWGPVGGLLFTVVLTAATLTSGIGCISSTAQINMELLHGKVSYRAICAVFCALSCVISCAGLDSIVVFLGPLLNACYPPAIVLALYYALTPACKLKSNLFWLRLLLCAATFFSVLELMHVYFGLWGVKVMLFERFYAWLPLSREGLAWAPFVAVVFPVSCVFGRKATAKKDQLS